ncbi:MAG: hypothetical protein KDB16_20510, partial [Acidimicrobiales bacterium]|nr:hypothetical protein [Acidimicrobiales bacterium]
MNSLRGPAANATAQSRVPARAALVGNPSDGYGGAVLGLPLSSVSATVGAVCRKPTGELDGGLARLVAAATEVVTRSGWPVPASLDWFVDTTIPREVGLSGSSAVILGVIETLAQFAGIDHSPDVFAAMALSAEVDVLGWTAGLQDRVLQAHNRPLLMDFDPGLMTQVDGWPAGRYTPIDARLLPAVVFVAYRADMGEPSHAALGRTRLRLDQVHAVMADSADLARRAHQCLLSHDLAGFGDAMNRSFQNRCEVLEVDVRQIELVDTYRDIGGVAVNSAGSGGSVSGAVIAGDPVEALARIEATATRCGHGL